MNGDPSRAARALDQRALSLVCPGTLRGRMLQSTGTALVSQMFEQVSCAMRNLVEKGVTALTIAPEPTHRRVELVHDSEGMAARAAAVGSSFSTAQLVRALGILNMVLRWLLLAILRNDIIDTVTKRCLAPFNLGPK